MLWMSFNRSQGSKGARLLAVAMLLATARCTVGDDFVAAPAVNENGCLVHEVTSAFQAATTQIRVLLPAGQQASDRWRVIYVLPVEAGREERYGDGLAEVKKHDLQNKHRVVFVAPTFAHLPWYADHPTDAAIRQEAYFLNVVVPFVEKTYHVRAMRDDRLLLGLSKSGWGAWSLLLRHSDVFGKAAAWDAPLAMHRLGQFGTTPIFGTQENFEQYRVCDLLRMNARSLGGDSRLILTGYGNFLSHHEQLRRLLNDLKIRHEYRDGPQRKHDWHSGWVPEAVELLLGQ